MAQLDLEPSAAQGALEESVPSRIAVLEGLKPLEVTRKDGVIVALGLPGHLHGTTFTRTEFQRGNFFLSIGTIQGEIEPSLSI
jgi:hypothetical protein